MREKSGFAEVRKSEFLEFRIQNPDLNQKRISEFEK